MNNLFLLFYSPKPRSHDRILMYRKWPIGILSLGLTERVQHDLTFIHLTSYLKHHLHVQYGHQR